MEHLAIDLGGRESQICVRSEAGEIVLEKRCSTQTLGRFLAKRDPCRVILETSAEAFAIADEALALGHDVRVVPATLAPALGVGHRGIKTDRRDARMLSEVSCRISLPSVHVSSAWARETKSLCAMRENLIEARRKLVNGVHGWLRTLNRRVARTGVTRTFARRVRETLTPPPFVDRQLVCIELLSEQIAAADAEVKQRAKDSALCRRLMTVPGIGPVTALRFVAAVDDVTRFANASQLSSYLGLVPGERSSSDKVRRTSITKAGSSALRRTLVQAAWATRRFAATHPIGLWAQRVEHRRGRLIAVVAVARKLSGILYAMWRDGTSYQPARAADRIEEVTA